MKYFVVPLFALFFTFCWLKSFNMLHVVPFKTKHQLKITKWNIEKFMFHGTKNCFKSVVQDQIGSITVINIAFSANQEKTPSGSFLCVFSLLYVTHIYNTGYKMY